MSIPYQELEQERGGIVPGRTVRYRGRPHRVASVTVGMIDGMVARLSCGPDCPEDCDAIGRHVSFALLVPYGA